MLLLHGNSNYNNDLTQINISTIKFYMPMHIIHYITDSWPLRIAEYEHKIYS